MPRPLRWYDYITININWFAITSRSNVLTPLVIPLLVQQFVGEEVKGTYLGKMRLWALMAALLTQAITGLISDHSRLKIGRRRPFILIGVAIEIISIILIGWSFHNKGMSGYWILFILYILIMIGGNINHAATQGFIPDLIPDDKKGIASGIKAVFEVPLPLIFVSVGVATMVSAGNMSDALTLLIVILLVCTALSMLVPEKQNLDSLPDFNWKPILRPAIMTGIFTIIILGIGAVISRILPLFRSLPSHLDLLLTGFIGVTGIALAVVIGIWGSLQIGLGKEIKKQKSYLWWVVNRLFFLVGVTNLGNFLIFFLQEKYQDFKLEQAVGPASKIILIVGIFVLLTALFGGWLADRFGKKMLIMVSGLATAIGTGIVVLVPNMETAYSGGAIIGLGVGLFYTANWALVTEIVPKERAGQFLGFSNLAGAGAGAIGAYIGGPIADSSSFSLLMALSGVLALLSILALIGIKSKR
ncbi:MAG: MFS transporter [Anaerolineales bacterium]